MLGNFQCFYCYLALFKINFFYKILSETLANRILNGLDQDQDRHSVDPDVCSNCLQRLSVVDKSRSYM